MDINREDLRDELILMLRTGRELAPDTDGYLADGFLDRLQSRRPARPLGRQRRRLVTALLLAAGALAVGTPLAVGMQTRSPSANCSEYLSKSYPSHNAMIADAPAMAARGFHRDGADSYFGGRLHQFWQRACR